MRILITGATSGIGKQLALDYLADGEQVVAWGRNPQALAELKAQGAITQPVDVTDPEQLAVGVQQLTDLGVPDLTILAAGNCEYVDNGELDLALFERQWQLNFQSQVALLSMLLPLLKVKTGTAVYGIGSSAQLFPFPRAEAYGASKAAINYLYRSLRVDWQRHGIHVGLIEPGFVKTPLTDKNDFSMPFLLSVADASARIRAKIDKGSLLIQFPKRLIWTLKLLALLPESWQFSLQKKWIR
jgi:NAD(P)-dependent dehydrogenase (short-subunit alcohol dehydrogenase family)